MSELRNLPADVNHLSKGAPRGQKRPFRPREVWAIRARLEMLGEVRNLALLNLAIDSKLRGCDLVRLKVS
ncbi:MAG: integrase, partial [Pseudomonadota bacterium]